MNTGHWVRRYFDGHGNVSFDQQFQKILKSRMKVEKKRIQSKQLKKNNNHNNNNNSNNNNNNNNDNNTNNHSNEYSKTSNSSVDDRVNITPPIDVSNAYI